MPNTVLVGAQWGDEGKGKIIDVLTRDADLVVRFQGGNNAGHTVKIDDKTYVLHLIPSGIFFEDKICIIGNGVVINPVALLDEIEDLRTKNIEVNGRLFVSDRAHVVLPFHGEIDAAREARLSAETRIGTTKRGIGPAYSDKVSRTGLRICDLTGPDAATMLETRINEANCILQALDAAPLDVNKVRDEYLAVAEKIRPFVADTIVMIHNAVAQDKAVLFEGAQGAMLDIDYGTYPFVTSSNATAGGACTGTGMAPNRIDRVIGVIKTYTTRVGEGPFPTELDDDDGKMLAERGHEFGATTGRPRRCGWFDAVIGRYSAQINGVNYWAMTKLDVLDSFETIKICTAYEVDGKRIDSIPADVNILRRCKPVYEEWPGWMSSTSDISDWNDLPEKARTYINRLCELTGTKLGILSVGPKRSSTMRIAI